MRMNKRYQQDPSRHSQENSRRQIIQVIREVREQRNSENSTEGDYFEKLERETEEIKKETEKEEEKQPQEKQMSLIDEFSKVQQESLRILDEYENKEWIVNSELEIEKAHTEGRILVGVFPTKRKKYAAKLYIQVLKRLVKIGTYDTLDDAAFYHDLAAVQVNGVYTKTNYIYTRDAMQMMVEDQRVSQMLVSKYSVSEFQ